MTSQWTVLTFQAWLEDRRRNRDVVELRAPAS
jgi:hypothetical protein